MAVLLRAQEITKNFGIQTLYEDLDLSVEEGDRLGIIGPNGVGKSTLLKILMGHENPDAGSVVARKNLRIAYVPQMADFDPSHSVIHIVEAAAAAVGLALEERHGAAHIILGKVGFEDPDQLAGSLSGGWQKRLTHACGLVGDPDVVLFDEPTNHLDTRGVLWLEELLAAANFTWVLVTHDRYFLSRTAKRIAELNPIFPQNLLISEGDYPTFLRRRREFLDAQSQYIESLRNKVRRETDWLRAGVKARTTKAKYRIDAAHALIEELEETRQRTNVTEAKIAFSASDRQTRKLVEAKAITKKLGDRTIATQLDLVLSPGRRLGLLGTNGTGKTTILRMLVGELPPDSGSVTHAPNLQWVYFDQVRAQLDPNASVRDILSPTGGESVLFQGREVHINSWARRFKFQIDQLPMPVAKLSGGEQARLLIARLMLSPADLLILDEPTNDLDIPTLEMLEESLLSFPGAVVLVTHDRFMLDKVCNTFLGLDGTGATIGYADYDQWELALREGGKTRKPEAPKKAAEPAPKAKAREKGGNKLSYMEQREWENMEATILVAEEQLAACQAAADDPAIASDGARLIAAHEALHRAEAEVSRLYERWSELSDKLEALNP